MEFYRVLIVNEVFFVCLLDFFDVFIVVFLEEILDRVKVLYMVCIDVFFEKFIFKSDFLIFVICYYCKK